jgi:hypothetical protein
MFVTPFRDSEHAVACTRRYLERDAGQPIRDAEVLTAGQNLLRGVEVRANLRLVFRWKLESFIHRFEWVRSFPDNIEDAVLDCALQVARNFNNSDAIMVSVLDAIPRVGVPVASAFLTAMYPERFTVTDRQAYRALQRRFRETASEYLEYLAFCRSEASRLGMSLRDHDRALWWHGAQLG